MRVGVASVPRRTVSQQLDRARRHFEAGKDRKAVESLWMVEAQARTGEAEAHGLLELASAIRDRNRGRVGKEALELVELAQRHLERIADPATSGVMLRVPFCGVVASEGFEPQPGQVWDLVFTQEAAFLRGAGTVRLEYETITSIDIECLPPPADRPAKVVAATGRVALAVLSLGFLSLPDLPILGITLRTSSGRLVLLHRSEVTLERWETQLGPVFQKVQNAALARRVKEALSQRDRDKG